MMDAPTEAALVIIITSAACLFAWKRGLMTRNASVAAFFMAIAIGFSVNMWWSFAFFLFPLVGFAATKMGFSEKQEKGLQEGKRGERHLLNILGVGIIPTVIAIAHLVSDSCGFELAIAFMSALAVSTSDTVASEIGIRDRRVYMITTLKPCEVGLNGGVSCFGMFVSVVSALAFSLVAYVLMEHTLDMRFLIPAAAGILGNLLDSVFGALFENRGKLSKYTVNGSTGLIGAVAGFLLALIL